MEEVFVDRKGGPCLMPKGRHIKKRKSVYGIAVKNGRILLVKPIWKEEFDLPGGGIEENESIEAGLRREMLEETGLRISSITPIKLCRKAMFYADDIDEYFDSEMAFFLVKTEGGVNPTDKGEISGTSWVSLKEIKKSDVNKVHLSVLEELGLIGGSA